MSLKPFQSEALKIIDDTQDGVPVRSFMEIAEERGEAGMSVCTALNNLLSSCIVNAADDEELLSHLNYVADQLTKAKDAFAFQKAYSEHSL